MKKKFVLLWVAAVPMMIEAFLVLTPPFSLPTHGTSSHTIVRYGSEGMAVSNSSGDLGSYLLQLKEKETLLNSTTTMNESAVELDPVDYHKPKKQPSVPEEPEELDYMDLETARELDDSIHNIIGSETPKILEIDKQYLNVPGTSTGPELPLSRPEHYLDRIDRDRRHLAVSISSTIEDTPQWRLFCQEGGGIFPILETVREGAVLYNNEHAREDTFHAACSACRAIRDLCAISPEQAAVITDSILRANAHWKGGLFDDFRTILTDASDFTEPASKKRFLSRFRNRRDARLRCKLYVTQLLLAMTVASDDAISAIRATEGLSDAILHCSSYARKEQTRRWLRYPGEMIKWLWKTNKEGANVRRPFLEAANVAKDLNGQLQMTSNQILAAIGCNRWIPKIPGQKGLRILCLDGGGSRGMVAVSAVKYIIDYVKGADVADSFDMIVGTSTGGIIAFLLGLQRESSTQAVQRYEQLISKIFVKSALATPLMLLTTATYDESNFMGILLDILKEETMLDSRADPAVPLVCALASKMSSTPTHVALFRNYNYVGGELADPFTIDPVFAREDLDLPLSLEHDVIRKGTYQRKKSDKATAPGSKTGSGSRHPGSFRVLQRYALRASTAAPTVFKPVMMGGEMYCDGGIVTSNPSAVAIHEARTLFPSIPIELVVSVGTGGFIEQKTPPRVGWDGIIGQIVNSATDAEQVHHILEDVLGQSAVLGDKASALSRTRYFRFNPVLGLPSDFPIDITDPKKLKNLRDITYKYMAEPEQQAKLGRVADILNGHGGKRRRLRRFLSRN